MTDILGNHSDREHAENKGHQEPQEGQSSTTQQSTMLTRRNFVTALAGASFAVALGGLAGCAPSLTAEAAATTEASTTISCDVLVLGGGAAGITSAAQAAVNGANTILLEKTGWLSGSSSLALGNLYGAGTKLQKEAGIEDDTESLYEYFMSKGGDKLDPAMQRFCAENFGDTVDWLHDVLGVPFKETILLRGTDTIPRAHSIDDRAMVALDAMSRYAEQHGVEVHYETAAQSFVVDEGGSVTGVLATKHRNGLVYYAAKKTIIATGGFCRNPEMIDEYCPDYSGVYTEVGTGCTGEGLQMGLDIGADYIGHGGTNGILACEVSAGQSKLISKKALWVDRNGVRFDNEAGQTHDIYYTVSRFPDQSFFAIYDQTMVDELDEGLKRSFDFGMERGIFTTGATVKEAADKLGINGQAAQKALDAYNEMALAGTDTQFGKKDDNFVPLTEGPFYVLKMGVCTHGSFGGYNIDTEFRVLNTEGAPINNLYAAGEVCCGAFIYDDYPAGGCGLNFSYTSGRFAGVNAARAAMA